MLNAEVGEVSVLSLLLVSVLPPAGLSNPFPSPTWSYDVQVWDMSAPTTWMGPGHDYVEAIMTPEEVLLVCAVVDASIDSLKLFSSEEGGACWIKRQMLTSSWSFRDPEMYVEDGPVDNLFLLVAANSGEFQGMILVMRMELPHLRVTGVSEIPWNQSGTDTLNSLTAVWDPETCMHRLFADDVSGRLYSASSPDGLSWSPMELLVTNASRPVAAAGPGGRVYVAYQETVIGDIHCLLITPGGITDTVLGEGAEAACPDPACEWTGGQTAAVVWHSTGDEILLSLSDDSGNTWSAPQVAGTGIYPCLETGAGSSNSILAYVDAGAGLVRVVSAGSIEGLLDTTGEIRGGVPPSTDCPPVVRQGPLPSVQALFFLGSGSEDIWFDSALYTGIHGEEETGGIRLCVSPNPSAEAFSIEWSRSGGQGAMLSLYSIDGRLLECLPAEQDEGCLTGFGSDLPTGAYIMRLSSSTGSVSSRFVKL